MRWSRRKIGVIVAVGVILKVALAALCWAFLRRHGPLWAFVHSRLTIIGGLTLMGGLVALLVILGAIRRLGTKPRPDGDAGTATIEMALVFPILLVVVLVMIQSMLVVSGNLAVHLAAYAGARSAIVWIPEGGWNGQAGLEARNIVGDPATSVKFQHIHQAVVLTLTPVCAGKSGAGGAGNAIVDSQTIVAGIGRYYSQSGQATPAWVNNMLKAKLQYAQEFTEVTLDPPASPPAYGEHEDIRVHVRHRLYLPVPYVCRLFGEVLPNGIDYATSVEAAYSLTNQGSVDQIDVEVFPRPA